MDRAVFLDRDGTLIKDKNYLDTPEGVEWFEGVFEALHELNEAGFQLVVITNQSGVARGYMTERDVQAIHERMKDDLRDEGLSFAGVYYCPYLTEGEVEKYTKDSPLRKPSPGMLHQAQQDLGLDLESSYMIGDKDSDVETGLRGGCRSILVRTGKGTESEASLEDREIQPDAIVDDLPAAADWILRQKT